MSAERIDHAAIALELVSDVALEVRTDEEMVLDVPVAQVHATLALVEQQRIANLMYHYKHIPFTSSMDATVLLREIRGGLGL